MIKIKHILIVFNVLLVVTLVFNKRQLYQQRLSSYGVHYSDSIDVSNLLLNNALLSDNTSFNVSPSLNLVTENDSIIKLSDIVIDNKILVIRFNEFSCLDCVFKELENIHNKIGVINSEKILLLASYKNTRHLNLNKRFNNISHSVYNIPKGSLCNSIDKKNIPYLFVLDYDYKATNLFIPAKDVKGASDIFLKTIEPILKR